MFGGYGASDDLGEGSQLFVRIDALDGDVQMDSCGTRSFQEAHQAQCLQLFMESSSDRDYDGEIRALGRIEVEEEVVRMLQIGKATGPGIVVDATEAGQKQQGSAIVGGRVVNFFSTLFGIEGHGCEPFRDPLAQVFLKERLALDSVRIATQNQSPVAEKGQDKIGHAVVVGQ